MRYSTAVILGSVVIAIAGASKAQTFTAEIDPATSALTFAPQEPSAVTVANETVRLQQDAPNNPQTQTTLQPVKASARSGPVKFRLPKPVPGKTGA